jgi:hypothetical protein
MVSLVEDLHRLNVIEAAQKLPENTGNLERYKCDITHDQLTIGTKCLKLSRKMMALHEQLRDKSAPAAARFSARIAELQVNEHPADAPCYDITDGYIALRQLTIMKFNLLQIIGELDEAFVHAIADDIALRYGMGESMWRLRVHA